MMWTRLKRLVTVPAAVLGMLLMLIEEHLWHGLVQLGEWLGHLPLVRQGERRIAALSPFGAMIALLAPVALAVPAKLAAVWLMATGHVVTGVVFLLGVKITGTAIVARIYTLCRPALETVAWFVRVRASVVRAKDWAHRKLNALAAWQLAQRLRSWAQAVIRGWVGSQR
jgi:hypothetical protein